MAPIAKIAVDLSLDREFDYRIPDHLVPDVRVGSRVHVPFGKSRKKGFVIALADRSERADLKAITSVVGTEPLIADGILDLARWMSVYYCAPLEQAIRTVLPGAVRRTDARRKERLFVELEPDSPEGDALQALRARAPRQAAVIDALRDGQGLFLTDLIAATGTSSGTVRALQKKGLVRMAPLTVRRNPLTEHEILPTEPMELMPAQAEALKLVCVAIDGLDPPVVLLHGVTGSGKTEVYLQAIAHALEQDRGAIVLVPEISLTPQTVERFFARFGDRIAVLHSHLAEGERHDEWHRIRSGEARIVIGARSAVFAPVRDLGLIVVDEEHEPSYKQEESPRYNARDMAVMRGKMHGCAVLLGSATPALESTTNARRGKYAVAVLPDRVDHRQMPTMQIVDMRVEAERTGRVAVFSQVLVDATRQRLDRGEQSIFFLNRRGYATSLICPKCGHVAECAACSLAFTYHKADERLRCHICGDDHKVPGACPGCGDPAFRFAGLGTQRVEEVIAKLFVGARVARLDTDVTRRRHAFEKILGDFRSGKTDIIVGTQMIAKGLHFPNVTLIGVINADLSLHKPDFRAGERTFQLLTQVAGRAGRGDVRGHVIVQTYTPFHAAVQAARRLDYDGFYDQEIEFRRELMYPPFSHLACITVRGRSEGQLMDSAGAFAVELRSAVASDVLVAGPCPAPLARAKGYYRVQIIVRSPSHRAMAEVLRRLSRDFRWPNGILCVVDIDAVSLM
jgi:primosomal protein N' (replication factor Y)